MIAFPIENRKGAFQFGGQFLLDPNEFNGMAAIGFTQDTFNTSLSSVGGNPQSIAGGFMASDSIRLTNFKAKHRNTSALALAWGWRLSYHTFVTNSTGQTNILRECVGLGATATAPRNYLSTNNQLTEVALNVVIPKGAIITIGVESPTAIATNYYVQVMSGILEFELI